MHSRDAIALFDLLLQEKNQHRLNPVERKIIEQSWDDIKYDDMQISGYECGYIKTGIASRLWKRLSKVIGVEVTRRNFKIVVQDLQQQFLENSPNCHPEFPAVLPANISKQQPLEVPREIPIFNTLDSQLVGIAEAFDSLHELVQKFKIVLIKGLGGLGKTTLARQYMKFLQSQNFHVIEYDMGKEAESIISVEILIAEWLKKHFAEEPAREFAVNKEKLKQQLQERKVAILIDNLESALDAEGKFIPQHRGYLELLRVLTHPSVQCVTLITSREFIYESVDIETYELPSLTAKAWQEFFTKRNIILDAQALKEIHKAYGGNALAMKVLCHPILKYYNSNLLQYWQSHHIKGDIVVETSVKNLIAEQFNRLQKNQPKTYNLLCRLGCYRYQNFSTVPISGLLCLLWDIPELYQRRYVIKSLQNVGLFEFECDNFWLHPVIREEARKRLMESADWEQTNRQAAKFWQNHELEIDDFHNLMKSLEAFYHYCIIFDWQEALKIIHQKITLGGSLIQIREKLRFCGYSHYLIDGLTKLNGKLLNPIQEGKRLGIMGVCFYYLSEYRTAIKYLQNAQEFFENTSFYYSYALKWLAQNYQRLGELDLALKYSQQGLENSEKLIASHENDGGCKCMTLNIIGSIYINLGDYEKAINYHEQALELSKIDNSLSLSERDQGDAFAYIAYCQFALNNYDDAIKFAHKSLQLFSEIQDYVSESLERCFLSQLYLSMGKNDCAEEALACAKNVSHKVKFLDSLLKTTLLNTEALLLVKIDGNYQEAIRLYNCSIQLNKSIGAKYDWADTAYHLGLLYQEMGKVDESQSNFNEAIRLFQEMKATKQVEKVKKAMSHRT
jgi:tetratricopeptide (TPR) repeat protein